MYKINNVIVASPNKEAQTENVLSNYEKAKDGIFRFIYPAFPRVFKNIEMICEASRRLVKNKTNNFEVILTISGDENKYARKIYKKYRKISNIKFSTHTIIIFARCW